MNTYVFTYAGEIMKSLRMKHGFPNKKKTLL